MSSRRSIVWLLFFIALAAAAHVLVSTRSGRAVLPLRPTSLAPGADRATLLELSRSGAPSVVVVRTDRWKMIAPFASSVDTGALLRVLDALAFAPVSDVLTEQEMRRLGRKPGDFGLTSPALRVSVRRDLEETTVSFGGRTPGGDGVYAAVSGLPGVCVIGSNDFARIDLPLDRFRDPVLLAEANGSPVAVDVRRAQGKFVRVSRSAAGAWRMLEPVQAPVSAARVESLVKLLAEARAGRFVWPVADGRIQPSPAVSVLAGYGLDSESAVTVTLSGADGSSRYVSFGAAVDGDSVYALAQNGGAVVTVSAELRNRILADADSFAELRLFPCGERELSTLSIADGDLVCLLARTPDGGWRLDSPISAPADPDVVHALVQALLSLRTTERDPHGLRVAVSTNSPAISVSRDALLVQNRLEDLRSKRVLDIPSDRIRRLSVSSADGRQETVTWDAANRTWILSKPEGAALDGLALAGVLGALDPLTAQSVVRLRMNAAEAGNYGLERPRFTIAIDQSAEGSIRRNVMIGSPAPGGGVYATVGSTDAVFILSDATIRALTARISTAGRE